MDILRFETNYQAQKSSVWVLQQSKPNWVLTAAIQAVSQTAIQQGMVEVGRRYHEVLVNGQYIVYLVGRVQL